MDDRRKRIDDLLKNSQESQTSLNVLLENFGEALYSRTKDAEDFEDIKQYNVYLQDIKDSNAAIGRIEEKNSRFKELEEAVEIREQEEKDRAKEMAGIFRRLGRTLLEYDDYQDFTCFFREQADTLKAKLESLETRIGELDKKEGGNVFSWIGKSAQALVLKSFLSKAQENQEQLYYNIGERFAGRGSVRDGDEVSLILAEKDVLRGISKTAQNELETLKDEKRIIAAGFGIDGNPQKQIQSVRTYINQINEKLHAQYRKFGAQSCGIDEDISPERKYFIDALVAAEDGEVIGRAARLNQSIIENEKAVAKLKASLSIDEEKIKIEKFLKSIEDKKNKIEDLKNGIADLEENVRDCDKYIQELEKQL